MLACYVIFEKSFSTTVELWMTANFCQVYFLDYGNSEAVAKQMVHSLLPKLHGASRGNPLCCQRHLSRHQLEMDEWTAWIQRCRSQTQSAARCHQPSAMANWLLLFQMGIRVINWTCPCFMKKTIRFGMCLKFLARGRHASEWRWVRIQNHWTFWLDLLPPTFQRCKLATTLLLTMYCPNINN